MLVPSGALAEPGAVPATAAAAPAPLRFERAHVVANLPGTRSAMIELVLVNDSGTAVRLLRVATPLAAAVSIHDMTMQAGVMRMRPVADLRLPAHGRVEFRSGGLHLMLTGLQRDLRTGEVLLLKFEFAGGQTLTAAAPVAAGQFVRQN